MALGDIITRNHGLFHHLAFEGPGNRVIEYTKRSGQPRVMLTTVEAIAAGGGAICRRPYPADAVYTPEQAWQRLYSRLGEQRYSVIGNNCESLLNWAIYGRSFSKQGSDLAEVGKIAVGLGVLVLVAAVLDAA